MGGAKGHVDDTMFAEFFDGCGHQRLCNLELGLAQDASHLTNECLSSIQSEFVVKVTAQVEIEHMDYLALYSFESFCIPTRIIMVLYEMITYVSRNICVWGYDYNKSNFSNHL